MRFFSTLALAASGLASMVAAQTANGPLYFTWIVPASVQVGQTYNVSYVASSLSSPVEIILREGSSADLDTIATLTSSATGGSYQWTVSKDLPNGAGYALQIKQGSDINYSKQFAIAGSSAVASSAASSASASGSSAASTASAASAASSGASSAASSAASTGSVTTSSHSSATSGASSTGSRTSSATGATAPTGAASNIKSPMALIFGAVAAMAYLQ